MRMPISLYPQHYEQKADNAPRNRPRNSKLAKHADILPHGAQENLLPINRRDFLDARDSLLPALSMLLAPISHKYQHGGTEGSEESEEFCK
jgi:hypothetical protein